MKPAPALQSAIPFTFFPQREAAMLEAMRTIRRKTGIRHFLLIAPQKTIRVTGFPGDALFETIGQTLRRVKEALAGGDFLISWWNDATLKVGPGAPYTRICGLGGGESPFSYCPLDPEFRRLFVGRCRRVAEIAQPHLILFEDDFELSNHGAVGYGCFCERHLAEFARLAGRRYAREELEKIFSAVNPESIRLRRLHAGLACRTLAGLAAETAAAVQAVAPATRLGLCQPGTWSLDGDMAESVTRAFAGRNRPWLRICGASYGADVPVNLPAALLSTLYTAQHLSGDIDRFYEGDTFPHNRFYCSAAMLESMITLALSYGCTDVLLYAVQQLPDPLTDWGYLDLYRDGRDRFAALRAALEGCAVAGIELVSRPEACAAAPWTGRAIRDSGLGGPADGSLLLGRYGFPYTTVEAPLKALIGDATPRILTDEALIRILSGPLFVDGAAARVLDERGLGDLLGLACEPAGGQGFNTERVRDTPDFRDLAGQTIYSMAYLGSWGPLQADMTAYCPLPGAEVLTDYVELVPESAEPRFGQHGLMRCVNRLGGRIVVSPAALATSSSNLYNGLKRELLRRLFRWLDPDGMPAAVLDQPNVSLTANVARGGGRLILTLINLSSDTARQLKLDVAPAFAGRPVEWLDGSGWRAAAHAWDGATLILREALPLLQPQVARLGRASR